MLLLRLEVQKGGHLCDEGGGGRGGVMSEAEEERLCQSVVCESVVCQSVVCQSIVCVQFRHTDLSLSSQILSSPYSLPLGWV